MSFPQPIIIGNAMPRSSGRDRDKAGYAAVTFAAACAWPRVSFHSV